MKNYIIALISLFFLSTAVVNAQEADTVAIKKFLNELERLNEKDVSYEVITYEKLKSTLIEQVNEQTYNALCNLDCKNIVDNDFIMINICSDSKEGYDKILSILEQHDAYTGETLFGIPLTAEERKDGHETFVFLSSNHSITINDSFDEEEIEILYCNYNLMDIIEDILSDFIEAIEDSFDEDLLHGSTNVNFSLSLFEDGDIAKIKVNGEKAAPATQEPAATVGCSASDIYAAIEKSYDDEIKQLEERAQEEDIQDRINELKEEKEYKLAELKNTLTTIDIPSFIENPITEDIYIAVPASTAQSGVYDWIASTGFCKGAKKNLDQESAIITPKEILRQYATEYRPKEQWLFNGYDKCKEEFATKYQSGTPAVLYRKSLSQKGYNDITADLKPLLDLELEDIFHNLEVTQKSINKENSNRYVRLYGEGDISVHILDNPEDKQCLMAVIIGAGDFEKSVNDYSIAEEKNIADHYNIIINENGITFTTEEYYNPPTKHKNGVHINFDLVNKYFKL